MHPNGGNNISLDRRITDVNLRWRIIGPKYNVSSSKPKNIGTGVFEGKVSPIIQNDAYANPANQMKYRWFGLDRGRDCGVEVCILNDLCAYRQIQKYFIAYIVENIIC